MSGWLSGKMSGWIAGWLAASDCQSVRGGDDVVFLLSTEQLELFIMT